jgi:hypothetical protein
MEGFSVAAPLRGGENLLTKESRQELAREREGVSDMIEASWGGECDIGDMIAGIGWGVEGPTNESSSTIEGSEGGVGHDWSPTVKLANIKRWAPDFDFLRPKSAASRLDIDSLLTGIVGIVDCLDAGIKPWVAKLGVGGKVCRFTLFGGCMAVAAESLKLLSRLSPSLL